MNFKTVCLIISLMLAISNIIDFLCRLFLIPDEFYEINYGIMRIVQLFGMFALFAVGLGN